MALQPRYVDYTGAVIPIEPILGGPMICSAVAALVAGLNINQALIYFRNWHKDGWRVRSAMIVMVFLTMLHIGVLLAGSYIWVIKQYGNLALLDHIPWPAGFQLCVTACLITITQGIFVARLAMLQVPLWITAGISFVIFGQLVVGVYLGINVVRVGHQANMTWLLHIVYSWEATAAGGDAMITVAMTRVLYRLKQATTFRQTRRAITLVFETNFLSSVSCSATTIVLAVSDSNWGFALNFISAQIYPLTVLISMNYRRSVASETQAVSNGGSGGVLTSQYMLNTNQSQALPVANGQLEAEGGEGVIVDVRKATQVDSSTDSEKTLW